MKHLTFILLLSLLSLIHVKAMPKNVHDFNEVAPDSLHKIWRFKSVKILVSGMFSLPEIYLLDLRRKDSIFYIDKNGKQKDPPVAYKIIDNAIVIQTNDKDSLQDKDNVVKVKFIISELTDTKLKLIVTRDSKKNEGKNIDDDMMKLTFEAQK